MGVHPVAVEVLVLRAAPALAYRRQVAGLAADAGPDGAAEALAGGPVGLLHSTSWRWDAAWGLVLTYIAVPDPRADSTAAVPLPDLTVAAGTDPLRPASEAVTVDQVAAHAVRHLALLRHTDPVVAAALAADPALDAAIAAAAPQPAGRFGWTMSC